MDEQEAFDQLAKERIVKDLGADASNSERIAELERMSDKLEATLRGYVDGRLSYEGSAYKVRQDAKSQALNDKLTRINQALAMYEKSDMEKLEE